MENSHQKIHSLKRLKNKHHLALKAVVDQFLQGDDIRAIIKCRHPLKKLKTIDE